MGKAQSDSRWMTGSAHEAIVTVGNPLLRRRAADITDFGPVQGLCDRMVQLLRELSGAGLAAPQIGESVRIIVVEVRKTDLFPDRPESPLYVMINPIISRKEGAEEQGWEGCFSVPGLMGKVARSTVINVDFHTSDGVRKSEQFDGYLARVIQHEIDHLEGVLFLNRMETLDSLTTVANYKQFYHPTNR